MICQPQDERAAVLQDPDLRWDHRSEDRWWETQEEGGFWGTGRQGRSLLEREGLGRGCSGGPGTGPRAGGHGILTIRGLPWLSSAAGLCAFTAGPDSAPGQGAEIPRAAQHALRPPKHKYMIFSVLSPGGGTSRTRLL